MLLKLDSHSSHPLYIQIYRQLKESIQQGDLVAGSRLLSKRQLAALNGISQNTVLNAYNQLLTEGYIYSVERSGYFVADVELLFKSQILPFKQSEQVKPLTTPDKTGDNLEILEETYRYNFTESVPDQRLFPFENFKKIYQKLLDSGNSKFLHATHQQGLFELRSTIQRYLSQSRGVPCQADQLILGPSSQYLIQLLTQLLPEITEFGMESPGYQGAHQLLTMLDVNIHPIPLDEYGAQPDVLEHSQVQLLYSTPNHQFPTGSVMPLERRHSLLKWVNNSEERYIIEDDYDSEFKYSGRPIPPLKQLDSQDKVIYMGSFSRSISPGIRISFMVLPYALLKKYHEKLDRLTSSLNTLNQWLVYEFMISGQFERHLNRSRSFYKKKRELLIKSILQIDATAQVIGADAGLHILLLPSVDFNPIVFKQLAKQTGIHIKTLADYSSGGIQQDNRTLFLSFSAIPETEFDIAIQLLYDLLVESRQVCDIY